jgi:hypothetical protein
MKEKHYLIVQRFSSLRVFFFFFFLFQPMLGSSIRSQSSSSFSMACAAMVKIIHKIAIRKMNRMRGRLLVVLYSRSSISDEK